MAPQHVCVGFAMELGDFSHRLCFKMLCRSFERRRRRENGSRRPYYTRGRRRRVGRKCMRGCICKLEVQAGLEPDEIASSHVNTALKLCGEPSGLSELQFGLQALSTRIILS